MIPFLHCHISLAHAYIYKVGKNQKSFKKMQKNVKKPLTSGDVCDIMSLPLPKGFFVVRIFCVQHGSHRATQTGLTAHLIRGRYTDVHSVDVK